MNAEPMTSKFWLTRVAPSNSIVCTECSIGTPESIEITLPLGLRYVFAKPRLSAGFQTSHDRLTFQVLVGP
jgi:hypothetical protein